VSYISIISTYDIDVYINAIRSLEYSNIEEYEFKTNSNDGNNLEVELTSDASQVIY